MIKRVILIFLLASLSFVSRAHGSWREHADDMYAVFGFQENDDVTYWMRFISSEMIDKVNNDGFYDALKVRYPWFKCTHRALFHWGYNAIPWNPVIEKKVLSYASKNNIDPDGLKHEFLDVLRAEQKRRNALMNSETEKLFGFSSGGRDARYANAIVSLAYDIHLVGDYMSDNRSLSGVAEFSDIIADIVISVRKIDPEAAKPFIKGLNASQKGFSDVQLRADSVMAYLKVAMPGFIRQSGLLKEFVIN